MRGGRSACEGILNTIYARPLVIFINLLFGLGGNVLAGLLTLNITETDKNNVQHVVLVDALRSPYLYICILVLLLLTFYAYGGARREAAQQAQATNTQEGMAADLNGLRSEMRAMAVSMAKIAEGQAREGQAQNVADAIKELKGTGGDRQDR